MKFCSWSVLPINIIGYFYQQKVNDSSISHQYSFFFPTIYFYWTLDMAVLAVSGIRVQGKGITV